MSPKAAIAACAVSILIGASLGLMVGRVVGFQRGERAGFERGERSVSRRVITSFQPCGRKWDGRIDVYVVRCAGMVFEISDNRNVVSTIYSYSLGVEDHGKQHPRTLGINGETVYSTTFNGYVEIPWFAEGWNEERAGRCSLGILAFTARPVEYKHELIKDACKP